MLVLVHALGAVEIPRMQDDLRGEDARGIGVADAGPVGILSLDWFAALAGDRDQAVAEPETLRGELKRIQLLAREPLGRGARRIGRAVVLPGEMVGWNRNGAVAGFVVGELAPGGSVAAKNVVLGASGVSRAGDRDAVLVDKDFQAPVAHAITPRILDEAGQAGAAGPAAEILFPRGNDPFPARH